LLGHRRFLYYIRIVSPLCIITSSSITCALFLLYALLLYPPLPLPQSLTHLQSRLQTQVRQHIELRDLNALEIDSLKQMIADKDKENARLFSAKVAAEKRCGELETMAGLLRSEVAEKTARVLALERDPSIAVDERAVVSL
jgi:hypothetical protein